MQFSYKVYIRNILCSIIRQPFPYFHHVVCSGVTRIEPIAKVRIQQTLIKFLEGIECYIMYSFKNNQVTFHFNGIMQIFRNISL